MKKLYIETYGCQMNIVDSEVVAAVMKKRDYEIVDSHEDADAIFINTCSVRDNAEVRIWGRLRLFNSIKNKKKSTLIIGLIGCMAERIGEKMAQEGVVDLVAGPDAYRDLPYLIDKVNEGDSAVNVELTTDETYDTIIPQRIGEHISGFVSITRGCNNFCTYCIVPYTRGRERSRDPQDIIKEIEDLVSKGYKEVSLLGQNVNSFKWYNEGVNRPVRFPDLMELVATKFPNTRVRFSTSHPKDISEKLIKVIAKYKNICNQIHLPVQSGSNSVLEKMNRKYDREWYLKKIDMIKSIIPDCAISTDLFCGFCGETEEEFQETLDLMNLVQYDSAFMFKYSERPGTYASKHLDDDIPEEVKGDRLARMIAVQYDLSVKSNNRDVGRTFEVLVEKVSKRSEDEMCGRNPQGKVIIFPRKNLKIGDYALVKVLECTKATLKGVVVD